jgi:hypothetical protein
MRAKHRVAIAILFVVLTAVATEASPRPRAGSALWPSMKRFAIWIQSRIVWPWPTPGDGEATESDPHVAPAPAP